MRPVIVFLCSITYTLCSGQTAVPGDTLQSITYDTLSVQIESTAYFPFCSTIYNLPTGCKPGQQRSCCRYSTYTGKNQKTASYGYVSCIDGTSFHWDYRNSLAEARNNFGGGIRVAEPPLKSSSRKPVKCLIYDQPAEAYILSEENVNGYKSYTLFTYGSHNGFYFNLELRSENEIRTNEDIPAVLRQILKIQL